VDSFPSQALTRWLLLGRLALQAASNDYLGFARQGLFVFPDSELSQKSHHRAPVRKRGLDQINRDKTGKQKPIGTVKVAEQNGGEHETTGN
jgi:hypothetical protein